MDVEEAKAGILRYAVPYSDCGAYLYQNDDNLFYFDAYFYHFYLSDGGTVPEVNPSTGNPYFAASDGEGFTFSNRPGGKETYVAYDGNTESGFAIACLKAKSITNYFNYNDLLPHFVACLDDMSDAYRGLDNPNEYEFTIDPKSNSSHQLFDFLSTYFPADTIQKWHSDISLYWDASGTGSGTLDLSFCEGTITGKDNQTVFSIAGDDAESF